MRTLTQIEIIVVVYQQGTPYIFPSRFYTKHFCSCSLTVTPLCIVSGYWFCVCVCVCVCVVSLSHLFCLSSSPLCLSVQDGESAFQIAVRKGHLDLVKVLVQVYRDLHMENEVDQYYMDLADDHHHEHLVEYLSSEFPTLKRKVSHRSLSSTHTYTPIPVQLLGHTVCCLSHNLSMCWHTLPL